ncbi:hypothetical protein AK812_SmicGene25024 [Symbiodinium microadriaticum]|uniref:Uncharacterized protein n=1 Tax=Symbiodinium microadriaticum TaxID=2951 RepID=A0A1Q9DD74_SYMMI|nr:hypothetical protein AK812_SmicGene25024 [Symbiodinium microadriaticum]
MDAWRVLEEGVSGTLSSILLSTLVASLWWKADGKRCLVALQSFGRGLVDIDSAKEAAVQSKLEDVHLPLARQLTAAVLGSFTLIAVLMDVFSGLRRNSSTQLLQDYIVFAAAFIFAGFANKWTMTPPLLHKMIAFQVCLGALHTILSDSTSVIMMMPLNAMLRLSASSMLLSERCAVITNAVASMVQLIRFLFRQDELITLSRQENWLPIIVILELGTSLMSLIPIVVLKSSFAEQLSTPPVEDTSQFFQEQSAARRMLAVLCDAQVLLGPDLNIISHDRGLAQLLMSSCSPLEGRAFVDFMAPRDIHRFKAFIESAVKVAAATGLDASLHKSVTRRPYVPPPTSLLVHITDSHGLLVAVELFHICVPGPTGERAHFIGISEAESNRSATASNSDTGSASVRSSHRTPPPTTCRHLEDSEEVMTLKTLQRQQAAARSGDGFFHPDLQEDDGRDGRESIASSASSDSSITSAAGLRNAASAPELDFAEISVDPFCDTLSIYKADFVFRAGKARGRPSLLEWLRPGTRKKCHSSICHAVNLVFAPPGSKADAAKSKYRLDPITLQLPSGRQPLALIAQNVELLLDEAAERGDSAEAVLQKRDAPLLIKLQLSDIMVKRLDRLGASKSQKLRELEELAKAKAERIRASSMAGTLQAAERDKSLEPIQERQRLRRTKQRQEEG